MAKEEQSVIEKMYNSLTDDENPKIIENMSKKEMFVRGILAVLANPLSDTTLAEEAEGVLKLLNKMKERGTS
ncbi:MAG: hypothetical protein LBT45_01675 [Rickettsiales bacterium]|jgi:hypothetical protein|nr:hypothetical protein [Rickettsiales bacterium]